MRKGEIHTQTELRLATPGQAARLLGRALMLRCPNCGPAEMAWHDAAEREWSTDG